MNKKILYIDLDNKKAEVITREDLNNYIGGVGIATKLLDENLKPKEDAFNPSQPVIFAIGPMTTVFPVVTKTVSMFKSPLTGELGESHAGGRFGLAMFMAGLDAIVITGKAEKPVYLSINNRDVKFKDARALWGTSQDDCVRAIRDSETGAGKRSIIRIGEAGEKLVKYACVNVDTYRHFGRMGLGAVLGSKNLKAIFITGNTDRPIKNFKDYFKVYQQVYKKVCDTEIMGKYHEIGTPINVNILNKAGGLPTKNLTQNSFENAEDISGEYFAKKLLTRKLACVGCPVGCIHIAEVRKEFDEGYEYETLNVSYDHELIFAVGSFLGTKTAEDVIFLIDEVEKYCMDIMSTGVVLGWATEAFQKGLIDIEQTIVPLAFGDTESYIKAIKYIGERKNEFYETLGEGVYEASKKYGGEEFALHLGKNEMAGYHTGYGMILGQSMGARHSHLCNAGYSFDQGNNPLDGEELVDAIIKEEMERCVLNSLCICLFARKVYDREIIIAALNSLGYDYDDQQLSEIGRNIYKLKYQIKKSMGYDSAAVTFPKRFFETESLRGKLNENKMNEIKDIFIKKLNEVIESES